MSPVQTHLLIFQTIGAILYNKGTTLRPTKYNQRLNLLIGSASNSNRSIIFSLDVSVVKTQHPLLRAVLRPANQDKLLPEHLLISHLYLNMLS